MSSDQPIKKSTNPQEPETPQVQQGQPKVEAKPVVTESGYVVPKGEEGIFHVEMEPAGDRFDAITGRKKFKSYVQKFHPRDFAIQISLNDRGEPIYATVGLRYNKILHKPADALLAGVTANIVKDRKTVKVPITEALEAVEKIIANQPK